MTVDRRWIKRNLGFDPITTPPPPSTFAVTKAARTSNPEDLQREIIDFELGSSCGQGVPRFHDDDRLVSVFRYPLAQGPCAHDRTCAGRSRQQPTAKGRCVGGHLDGG